MLSMKALRRIKPLGCVDDYTAGDVIGYTRVEEGEKFLASILLAIKAKPMSVPQLSKLTGRSRAAIARRLTTQKDKGVVIIEKVKLQHCQKLVGFYSIAKDVKC